MLSSRLCQPQSGVRPAEDFVGALTGNKGELAAEIRSVATWLDESLEGERDKEKRRPWSCARMHDRVPFEPFRDSRELSRAPVSLLKNDISRVKLYTPARAEYRVDIYREKKKYGMNFSSFRFFFPVTGAALGGSPLFKRRTPRRNCSVGFSFLKKEQNLKKDASLWSYLGPKVEKGVPLLPIYYVLEGV